MDKIDGKFIISKKLSIIRSCFINALLLKREAEILMDNSAYARAHFLIITALEEIAKAAMIIDKNIETEKFRDLIDHKLKAIEIVEIITKYSKFKPTEDEKRIMGSRITRMREDALYTRLKPTQKDQFLPDDKYWKKRAITFCNYLDKHIANISNFLGKE
jgi:AbiV family abortive infection protein